jgi:hypothetical protein
MLPQLVAAVVRNPLEKKTPPQTLGKLGSARRTRVGTARAYKTEQEVKNLKKKGGESNEKERITSIQPAPVLDAVLGCASRGRRDDLQGSYRHHQLLSPKVPGDARRHFVMAATGS